MRDGRTAAAAATTANEAYIADKSLARGGLRTT